jgi:hypothetical protein
MNESEIALLKDSARKCVGVFAWPDDAVCSLPWSYAFHRDWIKAWDKVNREPECIGFMLRFAETYDFKYAATDEGLNAPKLSPAPGAGKGGQVSYSLQDPRQDPPDDFDVSPCFDCMAQGCLKCNWIGYRAMTRKEIEQERAELRNPERA